MGLDPNSRRPCPRYPGRSGRTVQGIVDRGTDRGHPSIGPVRPGGEAAGPEPVLPALYDEKN